MGFRDEPIALILVDREVKGALARPIENAYVPAVPSPWELLGTSLSSMYIYCIIMYIAKEPPRGLSLSPRLRELFPAAWVIARIDVVEL